MSHHVGTFVVCRRHVLLWRETSCPRFALGWPLHNPRAPYSSTKILAEAPPRSRGFNGAFLYRRHKPSADGQPARQMKKARTPPIQRSSLLEQLQYAHDPGATAAAAAATPSHALVTPHSQDASQTSAASPYVSSPQLISAQRQAAANAATFTSNRTRNGVSAAAMAGASLQLQEQQRALRDAFTHARQHHNVQLRKDPRVYQAECRAFRQAHRGRSPTAQEVSRTVAVPLAPVSALKTLAHTDKNRSLLHSVTTEALVLHNAVVKNELVKSSAPQLVRCLRCFHVYTARPRTLWGSEVEQSGIEYEKVQAHLAAAKQLQRKPWLRKRVGSIGRRQRAQLDDPTCCPQCGSPRAQWMMEYVHHHTHEKL